MMWKRKLKTCPACGGTGRSDRTVPPDRAMSIPGYRDEMELAIMYCQGICLACRGKGEVRV